MSLRRLLLGHALFVVAGAAGASGALTGCSSDTTASATVFLVSQVSTSPDFGSAACGVVEGDWVTIGDSSNPKKDGDDQSGLTIHASCSVSSNSDGSFQVSAIGTLGNKGSVTIRGKFTTSGDQTGISATFQRGDFGSFTDSNCKVTYTGNVKVGVAGGRVAGHIECSAIADMSQSRTGPDGGAIPRTCEGTADFRFENCGQ